MAREKVIIDPILLRKLYIDDRISISKLATYFNCTTRTIGLKLRKHNIPVRSSKEAIKAHKRTLTPEQRLNISRSCRRGADHPNWKGGKVSANKKVRFSVEYKLWREAVYQRDNWTCQLCGQRGGDLEADHIKSFADHIDLRLEVSNGRTLCYKCHRKVTSEQRRKSKQKHIINTVFTIDSPHQ